MKHYFYEKDDKIYFYLEKESLADIKGCEPFIFNGLATVHHRIEYKPAFDEFIRTLAKKDIEETPKVAEGV